MESAKMIECDSVLGFLATKFPAQQEKLATEALTYIFKRSDNAANGMRLFLDRCGIKVPGRLTYTSQAAADDDSIPDLVATDDQGVYAFILEAKFWAGLTEHQPVTYLKRLPHERSAALIFLVPSLRLTYLWGELRARCRQAALNVGEEINVSGETRICVVREKHTLVLTSWRELLTALKSSVSTSEPVLSDLMQLEGLAARMDDDAFIPLRSEELTSNIGQRIIQFCSLVDDIAATAISNEIAQVWSGKRVSNMAGQYYYPIKLGRSNCYLQFNARFWARYRPTPIWLTVDSTEPDNGTTIRKTLRESLASLLSGPDPKVIEEGEGLRVPVNLLRGAERHDVIVDALGQLRVIADLLA
jgi:hypothetical protein